jgi:hypothetical protein
MRVLPYPSNTDASPRNAASALGCLGSCDDRIQVVVILAAAMSCAFLQAFLFSAACPQ